MSSSMNLDGEMRRIIRIYFMQLGDVWVNRYNCVYLDMYNVVLNYLILTLIWLYKDDQWDVVSRTMCISNYLKHNGRESEDHAAKGDEDGVVISREHRALVLYCRGELYLLPIVSCSYMLTIYFNYVQCMWQ